MSSIMRLLSFISLSPKLICKRQWIFAESKICFPKLNRSFSSCTEEEDNMSKIGINGFGRIGRLVLRASLERGGQVLNNL